MRVLISTLLSLFIGMSITSCTDPDDSPVVPPATEDTTETETPENPENSDEAETPEE